MKFFSIMYQTSNSKGQELVAQRMVKWALRLGHEGWLVTSVYHDGEAVISPSEVVKRYEGYVKFTADPKIGIPTIRVDSMKTFWPPRRIFFRDFMNVLRTLDETEGIDFILTHSTLWNGPEEVARWVFWKRLMKSLGEALKDTVYGHMSHYQPPDPQRYDILERTYRIAWNSTAFPSIFKVANMIVCVTGVEAEDMISMGARPDQIHIFPGGLDDDLAEMIDNANPKSFLDKFDIGEDKVIISYLGTIEERKNPLAVVRIAKKLRNLSNVLFVIAGKPGDQWEHVLRESRGLKNVMLVGELDEETKASLIKASYLNVIMSKMEALGLTQIEFMYGGVPVVSSGSYGQKWLIRNNVDGVIVGGPDDVEGAARVIEKLIKERDYRDELGRNARERAKSFLLSKLMSELLSKAEHQLSLTSKT